MDDLKIKIHHGQTGSHHDPYATELVTVLRGAREASWYDDGFGNNKLWLFAGA